MLDIALLGCGGMMPLHNRHLTSLLLRHNGRMLLIDSGEGTQITLKQLGWGLKNIEIVCFTHFHADHISGLPGLLLTLGNSDKTDPLTLIGPPGLKNIVNSLCIIAPDLPFEIKFIELPHSPNPADEIPLFGYNISVLPLDHGMPCFGYSVKIKRLGKFNLEKAKALGLPRNYWSFLQRGESVTYNGETYTPEMVMGNPRNGIKISYATDTRPTPGHVEFVRDSDVFVCEGLYGEGEKLEKASSHKHMIFSEAAWIAKEANVGELWLTHFSPAMPNPREFTSFATDIFENTVVGYDRLNKTIEFSDKINGSS